MLAVAGPKRMGSVSTAASGTTARKFVREVVML
jgi:hypothetical protein